MKNARIHLIYLAIIGFLAYQYWTKAQALNEAVGSIEQFDKLFKSNTEVVKRTSIMVRNEIEKDVKATAIPYTLAFLEKSRNVISVADSISKWLENQKMVFIQISGGFDKKDSSVLANRLSKTGSRQFYNDQKIQEIRDSLGRYQLYLNDVYYAEKLSEMQKQYSTHALFNNNIYWSCLKNGTDADALAQLTSIQNKIELDKVAYLKYVSHLTAYQGWVYDAFKVAIAPQKAVLIEGETFKTDIYLAAYSSNPGSDVTILVNNREITLKDGVSHFEKIEQTRGKKTIRAEARIKNPLTGQTISQIGEFEYEVLPKCSRDCK